MTLTASFDDATAKVTLTVASAPSAATVAYLQRSTDQVTWTDVRGAQAVTLTGGAATFLDYEYTAGVQNFYRATYDASFATFVAAGTAATANNAAVTPALPAGVAVGDLKLALVTIRSVPGTGRVAPPAGWGGVGPVAGMNIFWRLHQAGDSNPTFSVSGGAAGDDVIAQVAAFRNVSSVITQALIGSNTSAQNIALAGSLTVAKVGVLVLAGWKQAVLTTATGPAGMTQIGATSSAAGSGASQAWFRQTAAAGTVIGPATITVTGGTAAVSRSFVMALVGNNTDTANVTPAQTQVWLKNPLRPFLSRPVTVVGVDDITRQSRSALFDVIGRTLPVARTDLQSGRSTTLTLRVTNKVDADDFDGMVAVGEVLFVQPPEPGSPVPTMYALPGGVVRQRVANTSAVRRFPLGVTECATPDLTLAAVQSTWVTVTNTYATWADVVAAKASWTAVLQLVGTAGDVITS